MRGKPTGHVSFFETARITPADAGKTPSRLSAIAIPQDHPRGCGENRFRTPPLTAAQGSPPRMRGKLSFSCSLLGVTRITPADAGKTRHAMLTASRRWDHPRGCGENSIPRKGRSARLGSPPRMRGKLYRAAGIAEKYRITPADAGKTSESENL